MNTFAMAVAIIAISLVNIELKGICESVLGGINYMKIKSIRARKWTDVKVDMDTTGKDLKPGDLYVARRNSVIGWILLECHEVDFESGFVVPKGGEYCFDFYECHKVIQNRT